MRTALSMDRRRAETRSGRDSLDALYLRHCQSGTAIAAHLPRLKALATGLARAVEFGVKTAGSTCALLLGAHQVVSYDLVVSNEARQLQALAGDRWIFRQEDSRTAAPTPCDLILFDSHHSYDQVWSELQQHGETARRYLVFHDITTFGEVAAEGETGRQAWTYRADWGSVPRAYWGIRPAIDHYLIAHPEWRIVERIVEHHGLLVLERRA